ncbi:hypothetical protein D1831_14415, partial [Lactiplantibacillus garii]
AKTVKKAKKVSKKKAKKAKVYKISKNVLNNKKKVMINYTRNTSGKVMPIALMQRGNKIRIISATGMSENTLDYKVNKQVVKKNKMTLKLTPILTKGDTTAKGSGTIQLIRTGKNSYTIPKIYRYDAYRINSNKYHLYGQWDKPYKTSLKSLRVVNRGKLLKANKYSVYTPHFKF